MQPPIARAARGTGVSEVSPPGDGVWAGLTWFEGTRKLTHHREPRAASMEFPEAQELPAAHPKWGSQGHLRPREAEPMAGGALQKTGQELEGFRNSTGFLFKPDN